MAIPEPLTQEGHCGIAVRLASTFRQQGPTSRAIRPGVARLARRPGRTVASRRSLAAPRTRLLSCLLPDGVDLSPDRDRALPFSAGVLLDGVAEFPCRRCPTLSPT